jgi:hypothetical protein
VKRTAHYLIYIKIRNIAEFRDVLFHDWRHSDQLDARYDNVIVSTGDIENQEATAVVVIDVTISPTKEWMNTGSDIYLHYMLKLRKAKITIVKTKVESSPLVVDRMAAHNDYLLVKTNSTE